MNGNDGNRGDCSGRFDSYCLYANHAIFNAPKSMYVCDTDVLNYLKFRDIIQTFVVQEDKLITK